MALCPRTASWSFTPQPSRRTLPRGYVTAYVYDALRRTTREIKDNATLQAKTRYFYDTLANLSRVQDPELRNVTYEYDALRRTTKNTVDPINWNDGTGTVALDQTYDYLVPAGFEAAPGSFVLVPFGPQTRIGIVWDEAKGEQKPVDPKKLKALAATLGITISFHQSNLEGELVNLIQSAHGHADAIIMNPAAYSFPSIALIDALKIFEGPKIEVHISNIHARDELHRHSITSTASTAVICGLGPYGYIAAILAAVQKLGKLPDKIPASLHGLRAKV